jgi:hypothetical protein
VPNVHSTTVILSKAKNLTHSVFFPSLWMTCLPTKSFNGADGLTNSRKEKNMKFLGQVLLGAAVMAILGGIMVNCDAGRGRAQARAVNTLTRTVTRAIAPVTVTQVTIEEPDVAGFSSQVIEESEAWVVIRQHTSFDSAGCAEVTARRFDERTRYRAQLCIGGRVTTLRRE